MHHVAKVARRICQFRSQIAHRRQSVAVLLSFQEILLQQSVHPFQQVIRILVFFRKLALIDALAILQYQSQIPPQHASQCSIILILLQFLPHQSQQVSNALPFGGRHVKRFRSEVGEVLIVSHLSLKVRSVQQVRTPQQCPSAKGQQLTRVFQSAYLSRRHRNDGGISRLNGLHAIREILRKFLLDKKPIHPIVVQTASYRRQLIKMDDAHQRMQLRRMHVATKHIGVVNFQNLLHSSHKDSDFCEIGKYSAKIFTAICLYSP